MRQYLQLKQQYPDYVLFFRLGDFYEMFFEDAVRVSRELDLTLTSRDKGKENPTPMCGVPHHAAQQYLSKLVARGYRVALCEQVEDPKLARGIVRREVVRLVTPGVVLDEEDLDPKRANYLVALVVGENRVGLARLDATTGEFAATELRADELVAELARLAPREILHDGALPAEALDGARGGGRTASFYAESMVAARGKPRGRASRAGEGSSAAVLHPRPGCWAPGGPRPSALAYARRGRIPSVGCRRCSFCRTTSASSWCSTKRRARTWSCSALLQGASAVGRLVGNSRLRRVIVDGRSSPARLALVAAHRRGAHSAAARCGGLARRRSDAARRVAPRHSTAWATWSG